MTPSDTDAAAVVALVFGRRALHRHLLLKHPGAIERARRALQLHDRRKRAAGVPGTDPEVAPGVAPGPTG